MASSRPQPAKGNARPAGAPLAPLPRNAPRRPYLGGGLTAPGDLTLRSFADRIRQMRARRGMTRKVLARDSGVSERYVAQIEGGRGNISLLVMRALAQALGVPPEVLIREGPEPPVDLVHSMELLKSLSPNDLRTARQMLRDRFASADSASRDRRIALIGLRGAGKSTLGSQLAADLGVPFFELDRLIEQESGQSLSLVFDFHGQRGFRMLERRCLERLLNEHSRFVLATGGSLVSEPTTFERLLDCCLTVWIRTSPQEHMQRVIRQGDMRPMHDGDEAMTELKRILREREAFYRKADIQLNTSRQPVSVSLAALRRELERVSAGRAQ